MIPSLEAIYCGAGDDGATQARTGQIFYLFCLNDAVLEDHLAREIAAVLDLSWVYAELADYSKIGIPSIDPMLMIRMLIIGYAFAIRSERALCREVQVNVGYGWFCEADVGSRGCGATAADQVALATGAIPLNCNS